MIVIQVFLWIFMIIGIFGLITDIFVHHTGIFITGYRKLIGGQSTGNIILGTQSMKAVARR